MTFPMESVVKILSAYGIESVPELEVNNPVTVAPPAFEDLTIERIGENLVAVGHYYRQNGDRMCDPEITFKNTEEGWVPVEYIHHPLGKRQYDDNGIDRLASFISSWDQRLDKQGFVRAAEQDTQNNSETGNGGLRS